MLPILFFVFVAFEKYGFIVDTLICIFGQNEVVSMKKNDNDDAMIFQCFVYLNDHNEIYGMFGIAPMM